MFFVYKIKVLFSLFSILDYYINCKSGFTYLFSALLFTSYWIKLLSQLAERVALPNRRKAVRGIRLPTPFARWQTGKPGYSL